MPASKNIKDVDNLSYKKNVITNLYCTNHYPHVISKQIE